MRYARRLIAGPAAVLAATLGATAASAATTWTIKPETEDHQPVTRRAGR